MTENKKNAAGNAKATTYPVPQIALIALGLAMQDGAKKYGPFNWRTSEVKASVFGDALERHLLAWRAGENFAADSKIHHLAHIMAGAAIILDAELQRVFEDDRHHGNVDFSYEAMLDVLKLKTTVLTDSLHAV